MVEKGLGGSSEKLGVTGLLMLPSCHQQLLLSARSKGGAANWGWEWWQLTIPGGSRVPVAPAGHGWPPVLTQRLREDSRTASSHSQGSGVQCCLLRTISLDVR